CFPAVSIALDQKTSSPQRLLELLEALLRLPAGDLKATLDHVGNLVAEATGADKIDAFLYEAARDSLVAVGSSNQPLSALQRQLGLDVLQISNGGRVVHVYQTGETFMTGRLDQDEAELPGIKQALKIKSKLGVPLDIGGKRRGMMMIASLKPDFFTAEDARFAQSVAHWAGIVAHRAELAEQIGRNAVAQARREAAEELVTVVAHDLRNFLSPLSLRLEVLRLRAEKEQRAEDVRDAQGAARTISRLGQLVNDLLDVTRLDRGVFHLQPQLIDLGALTTEIAATLESPQHPILVRVQEASRISVAADPARLRQCVENLVANAVQQSPDDAAVSIFVKLRKTQRENDTALVEIIDEGPGIPQEMLPRLFDRYVTGEGRSGGLGLGLYLAKRVAAVHGGDLSVESPPGKGARFMLTLPTTSESA
ncbi:MAG TPA: GAF domain-containing sensor histidine kinase, partial [Burkholderiales bacterium]|nr:GAF domain-containing sensor histidine kinase [Burkholderiales bacterium]